MHYLCEPSVYIVGCQCTHTGINLTNKGGHTEIWLYLYGENQEKSTHT